MDDLIDLIVEHSDPAIAWKTLKDQFNSRDQSQILTLMGQLQSLKLSEGGAIKDYIRKARELKNRLTSMGERLSDHNINQIVMNGLPRSYESTIQTLTHLDPTMTFDKLSASLLSESHRRKHRDQVLGDEEALAASHQKQTLIRPPHQYGRGRWPPNLRGRGLPGGRTPLDSLDVATSVLHAHLKLRQTWPPGTRLSTFQKLLRASTAGSKEHKVHKLCRIF